MKANIINYVATGTFIQCVDMLQKIGQEEIARLLIADAGKIRIRCDIDIHKSINGYPSCKIEILPERELTTFGKPGGSIES